ncbi:MAG: glutamate 5-kinase [Gammaproteobacteria bacterium]|nr:MAG: glutamate 5-kinase [Gammaproteobacteria bacterium]
MSKKIDNYRHKVSQGQRWVVKVGSSSVTNNGRGLNMGAIANLASQLASLVNSGKEVILVSSGAIAEGMNRLAWDKRPHAVYELQAAAAVGQMGLIQAYESCLQKHELHSAQVLLTHEDLQDRKRYLNARTTLRKLLSLKVIPVVNENDTVATDEIKFGDNDTLAALVSNLVEADALIILTDQQGVFETPPQDNLENKLIDEISANNTLLDKVAGPSAGALGRGGMLTKVSAARLAARAGAATVIAPGKVSNVLLEIADGKQHGTLLYPDNEPLVARKQWIANQLYTNGELILDDGACQVICKDGKSLLSIGVQNVKGSFERGEVVSCFNSKGKEIARGLVNYNAKEASQLKGKASTEIESTLGYVEEPELIHRDNLVVL